VSRCEASLSRFNFREKVRVVVLLHNKSMTKLSLTLITELCRIVESGVSLADASLTVGVEPSTVDSWLRGDGITEFARSLPDDIVAIRNALAFQDLLVSQSHRKKKEDTPYVPGTPLSLMMKKSLVLRWLRLSIGQAEARNKSFHMDNIKSAGKKSWQASAWYLERCYAERYALKTKNDINTRMHIQVNNSTPRPVRKRTSENSKGI